MFLLASVQNQGIHVGDIIFQLVMLLTLIAIPTVLIIALIKRNKRLQRIEEKLDKLLSSEGPIHFDDTPDIPVPFGYKNQWIAIKTENTDEIVKHFKLSNTHPANWKTGINAAYEGYYFVSPPVKGWTLVVNALMPDLTDSTNKNPIREITKLSETFGEANYFGTHRVVEYHGWAKAINGRVVRAYGYLGESGETIVDDGEYTNEEKEHELIFTGIEEDNPVLPDEENVLFISKLWAADPTMDYIDLKAGVGIVGKAI